MIKKRLLSFLGAAAIAAALTFAVVSLSPSNGFTSGTMHSGLCYEATGVAPDAIVASVDGNGASADLIAYWTGYNVSYLDSYMQYYTGAAFDWDYTFEDGTSITDYVKSNVLMAVKQHLVLENLAEEYGATLTGITQNVEECLLSNTARMMFANSEFLLMLNQATTDREQLARLLGASDTQMSYVDNAPAGHGLIKVGGAIVPFANELPKNTELYRLMTTKPGED